MALAVAVGIVGPASGQQPEPQQEPSQPPNILVIVSDDQSEALFSRDLMPGVFERIVDRGVKFDRAYVNTSQCCPSRAQILTGLYGHHTGVDGNQIPLGHPTIVEALKNKGYRTAIAGKYLNSWPCVQRDEFDLWACITGSNEHASLVDPRLNVNGRIRNFDGYQTEVLTDQLSAFIKETPADQPFAAFYTTTSPHMPANDRRYRNLHVPKRRPASFDEDTIASGKPAYAQRGALTDNELHKIDETYRKMSRATRALDDSLVRLLRSLGSRAQNTLVIYISDNGYLYGEHRMTKKIVPYEESVNVPFAVRFPSGGGPGGIASQALVQNVDIAPTLAEVAGIEWKADGTSLLPLLQDPSGSVRDAALIENCHGRNYPCHGTAPRGSRRVPSYWGIVTRDRKYVTYESGETELYDLTADPAELENLSGDPLYAAEEATLAARLAALSATVDLDTTIVSGPHDSTDRRVAFRYFTHSFRDTYECRLTTEGRPSGWLPCAAFGTSYEVPVPGDYVFEVAGKRGALRDATPATWSFSVEASN